MSNVGKPFFAPQLYIRNGVKDVEFYKRAFGAQELRRFSNDDGSIHVSELSIEGAIFHLHEVTRNPGMVSPEKKNATTVMIGLFVNDVDLIINQAIAEGATLINPPQDYDYGYRQGEIKDPFGHCWLIEKKI